MAKDDERIRRGNMNVDRDQGIVERFNQTWGKGLFTFQWLWIKSEVWKVHGSRK